MAFSRPEFSAIGQGTDDAVRTLVDLIQVNARKNATLCFCRQAEQTQEIGRWNIREITFEQLYVALGRCCMWLKETGVCLTREHDAPKCPPVALFLESDVTLFIYVNALAILNCPALLLSARLSVENVNHLLNTTGAEHILVSKKGYSRLVHTVPENVRVVTAANYAMLLPSMRATSSDLKDADTLVDEMISDESDAKVIILHSSGTTGVPKPIALGHRYLLGYAACHIFGKGDNVTWHNFSTLPLYHGFGMLAPALSLSLGMTCCLPPTSVVPGAASTLDLLTAFEAGSLMSVPSIIDDIVSLTAGDKSQGLSSLAALKFVAIGGGPLSISTGETLREGNVNLLNHYGATEIGAIAPIFVPGPDYDWRYLRLRQDIGLKLRVIEPRPNDAATSRFKLVGYPFGWGGTSFEIQDDIEKRSLHHPDDKIEIRILGRRDDLIVLKTGEKVMTQKIETMLTIDPLIKSAVCLGDEMFELIVLVEPSDMALEHQLDDARLRSHIWILLSAINPTLDSHARISAQEAIMIKPAHMTIPRSDKGSVMRRETAKIFAGQIAETQSLLEQGCFGSVDIGRENVDLAIRAAVESIIRERLGGIAIATNQDLFDAGMDSLEATRLARMLNHIRSCLGAEVNNTARFTRDSIYRHPTIEDLCHAISDSMKTSSAESGTLGRRKQIERLTQEYLQLLPFEQASMLVTGSSGNLGIHMLSLLVTNRQVGRIVCAVRRGQTAGKEGLNYLMHASEIAGIDLSKKEWQKVSFLETDMQAPRLGLSEEQHQSIIASITHIVHLAWPMDFNRKLESYRPQLEALRGLLQLGADITDQRQGSRIRLLFASSISVVRHYADRTGRTTVPEEPLVDPEIPAQMGYAEAKYVCEQMLEQASKIMGHKLDLLNVRIGQLSGPETTRGIWKVSEHIPTLLKLSQSISAFPALHGNFSWLPVDRAARALIDILFHPQANENVHYHLENPIRQPFADLGAVAVQELGLRSGVIAWQPWLERVVEAGADTSLLKFFREDFMSLADGSVILETQRSRRVSRCLRGSGGLSQELIRDYLRRWREIGFLS